MSHTEYPPCFCGQAPTTDRTRLGQTWNDTLVFTTGTVCACGDRSSVPPLALKRGDRVFVRVSDSLRLTELGRLEAVRRIPRAWHYHVRGYLFVAEHHHGRYRWWEFRMDYRTAE